MDDAGQYRDDDLIYVDPESRKIVGRVIIDAASGVPKSLPYEKKVSKDGRHSWRAVHPWGTYRSMKHAFRLVGKVWEAKGEATLEDALPKMLGDAW